MSEPSALAEKLRSEGEKLSAFFAGVSEAGWRASVYTEGTVWTVRSVLAHLVTTERAYLTQLFPNVQEGRGGASADFSIDRYNARQQEKTRELSPRQLMEAYREARAELADWVDSLEPGDLETSGRHPYLGVTTLREMIKLVYVHNQIHYRDIRRAMR